MNLNSPPFPLPLDRSATSSFSCHVFFDESPSRIYHQQQKHQEDEGCVFYSGGSNKVTKMKEDGLKLSQIWKRDRDRDQDQGESLWESNQVKRMSSKTMLMEDTKYSDHESQKKLEDHKGRYSSSSEAELSSNTSSYNNNNNNNDNCPIRVCADCNTTKTPLWRSGPRGPKSLCNACGIRQRKARRAMAIAAAATAGTPLRTEAPATDIKVHQKEKRGKKGHTLKNKKLFKMASGASNGQQQKLGFEEFLINLNKDLAFHRVFPQDEKEAAILLMALSSGLVHS